MRKRRKKFNICSNCGKEKSFILKFNSAYNKLFPLLANRRAMSYRDAVLKLRLYMKLYAI